MGSRSHDAAVVTGLVGGIVESYMEDARIMS